MKKMPLPRGVTYIIDKLNSHGYRADTVGGSVRDFLLSRPCDDYDVTTNAQPDKIKEIFSTDRTVDTGIKHGTVTVIVDGAPHEVTTYRRDGEYLDNRHPDSVTFTGELGEDLQRRDFTVNAMCYNPKDGYTDLYGGMSDLRARVIRAVGDARTRFDEDALRIFRAIRFASVLDFEIEKSTADAVHEKRGLLANVSRERIYTEWRKLLSGKAAHRVITEYADVIAAAIPELSSVRLPDENKFLAADHTARLLSLYKLSCRDPASAFSASMRALKTDNAIRTLGESVLSVKDAALSSPTDALFLLKERGAAVAMEYVKLGVLIGELEASAESILEEATSSGIPYSVSMLAVNGRDLTALGFRGPAVGEELSRLLDSVIQGEIPNEKEALIACALKRN